MSGTNDSRYQEFRDTLFKARETLALKTVLELGIFEQLMAGSQPATTLAEVAGVSPERLTAFLDFVVSLGFLCRDGTLYSLIPGDETVLNRHLDDLKTWTVKQTFQDMAQTVDLLRQDAVLAAAGPGHEVSQEERHSFLMSLHYRSQAVAREVASLLAGRPVERLADLGCGAGTYTAALLESFPHARAVLVDRQNAAPTIERLARKNGYRERIDIRASDAFQGDFGEDYDLIIISNLLHCYGPHDNACLVKRAADRLRPGGRLAVKDFHIDEEYAGPRYALAFRMFLATITRDGNCYPYSVLTDWCRDAGLSEPAMHVLEKAPEARLFVSIKPKPE